MRILCEAKANKSINLNAASILFAILQIEIMVLFCTNSHMVILQNIFNLSEDNSGIQSIVILIFILNLMETFYFLFKIIVQKKSKNVSYQKSTILSALEIKPYLFFVQTLNFNVMKVQIGQNNFIVSAAIVNIIFAILEVFFLQKINISYRFIEKNYIRKKNNSILPWILIIPIIFTFHFYGSIYGSVFLLIRALTQLYFNFNSLENGQIRFSLWFFPLASIQLTFLIFADSYLNLSIFNNVLILIFIIIFTVYCCNDLSSHFSIRVLKYHLETCQHIMESQSSDNISVNGGLIQINEQEMEKTLLQLRIMVKIHLSRLRYDSLEENTGSDTEKFDNWWDFYNRFILDHKVYCQNSICQCSKMEFLKKTENHEIEKKIFADKIYFVIKKLSSESPVSANKLKIIENYFLIEMQRKPMKTYYQLMKVEREKLNLEEKLEIENLILETRENFKQLFIRQKIQNTELDIEPLFLFQDRLKTMRSQLNDMAVEYRHFYEIFANNFVQTQTLKQKTRSLTEFKKRFNQEIDFCLKNFSKSLELMAFCIAYFRFFDQYTTKLEKTEVKSQFLIESFKNPLTIQKKENADIFDPHYGAVKVDLAFKIGQIVTITKNLCHTLGFTHQQLSSQKVNKLMPLMFARNHNKFLRNFIEKGSLKILKFRQRTLFAKHMNKFLFPISIRLKVDYTFSDGFYSVGFIKPAQKKLQFILMNNYGKIQEITGNLYKKLFDKALGDDMMKVKRLCASKLILSLNYLLKNTPQSRDLIHQGLITTSDTETDLFSYFKFPQFGKTYSNNNNNKSSQDDGTQSSRTVRSTQHSESSTLDFSQDMTNYTIDLKESLRNYFNMIDIKKIRGYRMSYRFYTSVTNEFKFKVLQVIKVIDITTKSQFEQCFRNQIQTVGQYMGFEQQEISRFNILNHHFEPMTQDSDLQFKNVNTYDGKYHQSSFNDIHKNQNEIKDNIVVGMGKPQSGTSSILFADRKNRSKDEIIQAFEQQTIVSYKLEMCLIILIIMMAAILVTVSVFSISMRGNYQSIQDDNSIITNFRIQFLLRLAIQQLSQLYGNYNLPPPTFISNKKHILNNDMQQLLTQVVSWISMSAEYYQDQIQYQYSEINYNQSRTILDSFHYIYYIFQLAEDQEEYIIQNYGVINSHLLNLTNYEQVMVLNLSSYYKVQIHIIVAIYALLLIVLVAVMVMIKKVAIEKENKIIDFLPFFKSSNAKKSSHFFDLFIEYNKSNENLDSNHIDGLLNQTEQQNSLSRGSTVKSNIDKNMITIKQSSDRLIRIVKNEQNGITVKGLLYAIGTIILCLFVMGYAEYFFIQTDTKFKAYMEMKNTAFLVQLIPSRIILLYLPNIDRVFKQQPMMHLPNSFYTLAHDEIFSFMTDQSSVDYFGTQMQQTIIKHFTTNLCDMISCTNASQIADYQNQQLFYLQYRYVNAFNYLRGMISNLPNQNDPKATIKKWIDQNQVFQLLESLDFILDLMKKNQQEIADLFANEINQIGTILLSLSLTLIPILIFVMLHSRKMFIGFVKERFECTENIFKHFSWNILKQNPYAVNYFSDKLKNSKAI